MTVEEKLEHLRQRRATHASLEASLNLEIKHAVKVAKASGVSVLEISKILHISPTAVYNHLNS